MKRVAAAIVIALVTAACSGGGGGGSAAPPGATAVGGVVRVVAAENFWGDVTAQLGGSHVTVTSIISDPNADPHTYETNVKDAAAISSAGLVVLNGLGYDDFATKLLDASPGRARTVITVADAAGIKGDNPNPHLWYDPAAVRAAVYAIAAALERADPAAAQTFADNERAFLVAYQPYADTLATIKARYAGVKIAYTERVPGYLVAGAGLVLGTPPAFSQAVEDGSDPSPGDTATFDADITGHKVRLLFYNAQVTDDETDRIKQLAAASNLPIVGVTETMPRALHFQAWQIAQARAVLAALGG